MLPFEFRRWPLSVLLLTSLLASLACQTLILGAPPAPERAPTARSAAATEAPGLPTLAPHIGTGVPTVPATAAAAESGPASGEVELGPGDFNLAQPGVGLADLTSYQATLVLAFDGTQHGTAQQWTKTYVLVAAQNPADRWLSIEREGDLADLTPEFLAERDGVAYAWGSEQGCQAVELGPGHSLIDRLEPAGMLAGFVGADAAGRETINGLLADHYTFDERAFGNQDLAESDGEVWLAAEGGFVVRYWLATSATPDYFGDGLEGTLTWDYQLAAAGEAPTFDLPEDCPAGMVDAPQLPDASEVLNVPGLLAYQTNASLAEAAAWYEAALAGLGWELAGEPAGEPAEDVSPVRLDFAQAGSTLTIFIATGDGSTSVHIVLGAPAPPPIE